MLHVAHASGKPFEVALLDFLMPGMDGLELGERIKADPNLRATALVMLTSASQRSAAPEFLAAGFSVFMTKPVVRPVQLLDAISKAWYSRATESNGGVLARSSRAADTVTPLMSRAVTGAHE